MTRSPHLLIVDDDREIRDLVARFLKKHGFRVDTAADGREMDRVLAAGRFDLLVLDLMLPGEDGLVPMPAAEGGVGHADHPVDRPGRGDRPHRRP